MSLDHRDIVEQVDRFKNRVHDLIDDPHHPYGKALLREVEELVKDVKVKKPTRNIEIRITNVMRALGKIRNHGDQIMDYQHTDLFLHQCGELRGHIQQYYPY